MSSPSSVSGAALSSLASQLFNAVDSNQDGRLSTGEFRNFLEGLLNKVGAGGNTRSLLKNAEDAAAEGGAETTVTPTVYQPMLGFDYTKLNTLSHTTPKYVFARATQDLPFAWDRASRSEGLAKIADYAKSHGYPDTTVVGDDKLNFGDDHGDIDVLTGDGQWWWGPTT